MDRVRDLEWIHKNDAMLRIRLLGMILVKILQYGNLGR